MRFFNRFRFTQKLVKIALEQFVLDAHFYRILRILLGKHQEIDGTIANLQRIPLIISFEKSSSAAPIVTFEPMVQFPIVTFFPMMHDGISLAL